VEGDADEEEEAADETAEDNEEACLVPHFDPTLLIAFHIWCLNWLALVPES